MGVCEQGLEEPRQEVRTQGLSLQRGPWCTDSAASPFRVHPRGCPLKPGGGFDLGSAGLSAGRARCAGGGAGGGEEAQGPRIPQASPSPCTRPGQGDCFRLSREGTRTPPPPPHALQLFPSCPAPPQRQLGERLGAESGAQLLSSGAGTGEGDMKEPGPAGVAGGGNPPAVASAGSAHLAHRSPQWGGGEALRS